MMINVRGDNVYNILFTIIHVRYILKDFMKFIVLCLLKNFQIGFGGSQETNTVVARAIV